MYTKAILVALMGVGSAFALPQNAVQDRAALLPGLNQVQTNNARGIIAQVKKDKVGMQGCEVAIIGALELSSMFIQGNKQVPESLKYHYDELTMDHESVGIYSLGAQSFRDIACDMSPQCSAGLYINEMRRIKDWQTLSPAVVCQKIQRSGPPRRYNKRLSQAEKICKAAL